MKNLYKGYIKNVYNVFKMYAAVYSGIDGVKFYKERICIQCLQSVYNIHKIYTLYKNGIKIY